MKTITIYQPQASLIAGKHKRYETRFWATKHRGLIVIHAAKKDPLFITTEGLDDEVVKLITKKVGGFDHLPLGAIVAMADLVDVIPTEKLLQDPKFYNTDEILFGDYRPHRYAWELENIKRLREPIQQKGQQGLWNWDCPYVLANILEGV